jgi:hypothetical protein
MLWLMLPPGITKIAIFQRYLATQALHDLDQENFRG